MNMHLSPCVRTDASVAPGSGGNKGNERAPVRGGGVRCNAGGRQVAEHVRQGAVKLAILELVAPTEEGTGDEDIGHTGLARFVLELLVHRRAIVHLV